jgi:acyl-CoA synthetase (AMP-forming)/AMP-acid ligase II
MLTHKNLYIHALGTIAELNIKDTDSWYHVVPMFHLADVWSTWAITWVGGKHVLLRRFDTKKVLSTIEKQKITITNLIPTMFNLLLNDPDVNKYDYSSLRLLMSGGSHIAPKLVNKILQTFKCEYIQTYGMTETSPYLTFSLIKDHLLTEPPDKITEIRCTTGREFITVDLKVVRENGEEVNADNQEVGEIIVRGDTITPGYWQLPEETGKTIRDGWLYTGDLAVVNEEQYITIVDRKKDMIITGGENVYSTEVENILYMHPGILEVAVIGVPDEKWGETIKAFVVLKKDQSTTEDEIISFCRQYLAGYKIPRSIEILLELPKTGSGKIYKNILRETYWPSGKVQVR